MDQSASKHCHMTSAVFETAQVKVDQCDLSPRISFCFPANSAGRVLSEEIGSALLAEFCATPVAAAVKADNLLMLCCKILLFSRWLSQTLVGCKTHHWVFTSSSQTSYLCCLKSLISHQLQKINGVCRCQKMCCTDFLNICIQPYLCSCGIALRAPLADTADCDCVPVVTLWLTCVTHLSL